MEYNSIEIIRNLSDAYILSSCGVERTNNIRADSIPSGSLYKLPDPISYSYKTPPDGESWSQIRKSGRIKMTEFLHTKREESFPLVKIPHVVANRAHHSHYTDSTQCTEYHSVYNVQETGAYNEVTDYYRLLSDGYPHLRFSPGPDHLNKVKSMVVSRAASQLDLLTEFVERRKTMQTVVELSQSAYRPLQSLRDKARELMRSKGNPKKLLDTFSNDWLKYRYAISPIVYSIQDAIALLEKQNETYLTDRSMLQSVGTFPEPEAGVLYDTGSHKVTWRAVGKAGYTGSTENILQRISVNPFKTGWELIPYSFVVDWFVNVSDYISAQTLSSIDLAKQRKFCVSTRTSTDIVTKLDLLSAPIESNVGYNICGLKTRDFDEVPNDASTVVVRKFNEESYERVLFDASDIDLGYDPYVNMDRFFDAISLVNNNLNKSLRRLL